MTVCHMTQSQFKVEVTSGSKPLERSRPSVPHRLIFLHCNHECLLVPVMLWHNGHGLLVTSLTVDWIPPCTLPPQPFYGPPSMTTRVSRCQRRTSEDQQRQTHRPSGWAPLHLDQPLPTSTILPYFYRPDALLPPNQQHRGTEGNACTIVFLSHCVSQLGLLPLIQVCTCWMSKCQTEMKADHHL